MGLDMCLVKKKKYARKIERNYIEVGYWRKANQIHNYFVQNVYKPERQKEEYDGHYILVGKPKLKELLDKVNYLLNTIVLADGNVNNGYGIVNGNVVPFVEYGKVIANKDVCIKELPTTVGFFFGSTDYDQYYYEDLVKTKRILEHILETNDFKKYQIYYGASW